MTMQRFHLVSGAAIDSAFAAMAAKYRAPHFEELIR